MNDVRIKKYVDGIFSDVRMTATVLEQKEELTVNITERVRDYMQEGMSFDAAFEAAKSIVGDTDELTAPFEKMAASPSQFPNVPKAAPVKDSSSAVDKAESVFQRWQYTALSPFVYLLLGFLFGWWAWAWVIIPITGALSAPIPLSAKIISCSPFIYVILGFFLGWWAWGWIIIPVSGILFAREHM